jgi:hypothetical protein
MWINLSFHLLPRLGVPTTVLRYESLVADPRAELERVLRFAGTDPAPGAFAFIGDGEADLPPDHLVAGNRMRHQVGPTRLRVDDAWTTKLTPAQRRSVALTTAPLLWRYGYARRPRQQEAAR